MDVHGGGAHEAGVGDGGGQEDFFGAFPVPEAAFDEAERGFLHGWAPFARRALAAATVYHRKARGNKANAGEVLANRRQRLYNVSKKKSRKTSCPKPLPSRRRGFRQPNPKTKGTNPK
jgi:hypothetical protein